MSSRSVKDTFLVFLKGLAMGGADVVPGVSGGTVAFITGIYEELLDSINSVDKDAFSMLLKFRFAEFWKKINGSFLVPLFTGIIISLLTLAHLLEYLLKTYPLQLWSFFFGLIVISAIIVLKEVKEWGLPVIMAIVTGIAIAYYITIATPSTTPEALWFVFLSGCIAICAMILPGISGAFILLIFGKYEFILNTLNSARKGLLSGDFSAALGDLSVILVFALGCIVGLLTFARAVSFMLKKYHTITIGLLAGFMVGSLNKVWPWKIPIAFRLDSQGNQLAYHFKSVLPNTYMNEFNADPKVLQVVLFMALGVLLVVGIERAAHYFQDR